MFFRWAARTKSDILYRLLLFAKIPVSLGAVLVVVLLVDQVTLWSVAGLGAPAARMAVVLVGRLLRAVGGFAVGLFAYERLFQWRLSRFLTLSCRSCQEDLDSPSLSLRRGDRVVELHQTPFYDFARLWPLKLTMQEMVLIVYRETYRGLVKLGQGIREGTAPITAETVVTASSPFVTVSRRLATVISPRLIVHKRNLNYRISLALALHTSPFSNRIRSPRAQYQQAYMLGAELVRNLGYLEEELGKLNRLTNRFLARKRNGGARAGD